MNLSNSIFLCTKPVEYMLYIDREGTQHFQGIECYQHIHAWPLWKRIYVATWVWWKLVWRTHG